MLSSNNIDALLNEILSCALDKKSDSKNNCDKEKNNGSCLAPSQLLVIVGLITGVLEVQSILIDKDQLIQIRVDGSLKRKTELDIALDQIGSLSFDEVIKAVIDRLS